MLASTDPLLQPYQLKHLTLRNRIMSTSHEPSYAVEGMPLERYRLYHVEKARGGLALTMTAGSAVVSPDSPPAFGNLLAYKDEIVPHLARLTQECHALGTAVMIQITHMGRRNGGWSSGDWLPVLAPSPIREPAHRAFPKAAEDWDIARIVRDYAATAQRMQAAGMDGIEIDAYGHLVDQFWSPATNKRDDDYGGSLDNRLRFTFAVLNAIRKAVGPTFIVGIRMVADEAWEEGLSKEEGLEIAQRLVKGGQVDFLNIIRGHMETDNALTDVIPIMGMRSAPHLDFAGDIRAATKFPTFHAAKIADVATARHAVASGKLDMVGMTRAHLAEPHITQKIIGKREDRIRPCVGATYCLDRIYEGKEALCIHNAATGREATMPHVLARASKLRKVVVVGAGPAGLEAARVAGERGHKVVLFEAGEAAGGQILLAARARLRRDLVGIIDWRLSEIKHHDVALHLGRYAEAAEVLAENPDVVFIATGGLPNVGILRSGAELVATSWDILSGHVKPGDNVLVYDDNGAYPGLSAAQLCAEAGAAVEIITPERFFAPEIGGMNHALVARSLHKHGVRITINSRVTDVRRAGNKLAATVGSDFSARTEERLVDQVIVEHGTLPLDDVYLALKPLSRNGGAVDYDALIGGRVQDVADGAGSFQLWRIGDAVASRNIHAAIYDGLRLAKDI